MARVYGSDGANVLQGNPVSGQIGVKQIGRTLTWSGTQQYQTAIEFTKSGSTAFTFSMVLWYAASVRDNAEGRAGSFSANALNAGFKVLAGDSNVYNTAFGTCNYDCRGNIALNAQQVSSTGNNKAIIRFEVPSGWSPVIITLGGFINCHRWDLLTISYP
jgi:hypothetical protein